MRRSREPRFGFQWWDRGGHVGVLDQDGEPVVLGIDGPWPEPCPVCVFFLTHPLDEEMPEEVAREGLRMLRKSAAYR